MLRTPRTWEDTPRRIVDGELNALGSRVPHPRSPVKGPDQLWGDGSTHYRRQRWTRRGPHTAQCVDRDLDELPAMFALPAEHRRMTRTTNPIERCLREVRRRTRSMGTLVNDAGIERIACGLVAYMNREYATRTCRAFRKNRYAA